MTIDGGRSAAHALLAGAPDLTAVFVSNDLPALGVLQAAAEMGLDVPSDLSVIGITDIHLAHQVRPALTTVAVPIQESAELAVEMIMHQILRDDDGQAPLLRQTALPKLVVRASTGRVGRSEQAARGARRP